MADIAKRDENRVPTLLGVSSSDGTTVEKAEITSTTGRLRVDALITADDATTTDVDDDSIAKAQVLPLTINENYVFSKTDDAWIRMQGSTDGYQFVSIIGLYDSAGHQVDVNTSGQLETAPYGEYDRYKQDASTEAMVTVNQDHHEIHEGDHFFVQGVQDLAIDEVLDFTWQMPATTEWIHWKWNIYTESETAWYIYEGATATNPLANTITPINSNRNSSHASATTMKYELQADLDTANADTSVGGATLIASGISGSGKDSGNAERMNEEIVLKQGSLYCLRAIATAAGFISFDMQWYEHADAN